jgi:tRNA(Met) cytidine acetyltransferase
LLPQTLAAHVGLAAATRLRYARVMRIAVHPELQRRGIGSGLLLAVQTWAHAAHRDLLGCSFGLSPEALGFWYKAGLRPVRVGLTRDAASGTHSGVLLQDLSSAGAALLGQARRHFAEHLPLVLADGLQDLPACLAVQLAQRLPAEALADNDRAALAAFASGQRDYAGVLAPLRRFVWRLMVSGALVRAEPQARDVLVRKVIQRHTWSSIAAASGLAGRRAVLAALRAAVAAGLAVVPPRNPE